MGDVVAVWAAAAWRHYRAAIILNCVGGGGTSIFVVRAQLMHHLIVELLGSDQSHRGGP